MKKRFIIILALLLLLSGCSNEKTEITTGCSEEKPEIKSGWSYSSHGVFYLDESATPLTGWQVIDGNRYYFHPDRGGAMVCGWLELPEGRHPAGRYYFDGTGVMQTGWLQDAGKQYYLRPDGVMAVGNIQIEGKDYHFTASGEPFLLINRDHALPDDYPLELVELEGFQVARDCARDLLAMLQACRAAGYPCDINSANRDRDDQQVLWDDRYNNYIAQGYSTTDAAELTAQYVLPAGYSEHHTGLAMDLVSSDYWGYYSDLEHDYEKFDSFKWMYEHCAEFGFILRYPKDKQDITGITYEPWHYRFVGVEAATYIMENGLCLEEYLEIIGK
jgi:LAS superfamily LD-carboxypeptidase LdcB